MCGGGVLGAIELDDEFVLDDSADDLGNWASSPLLPLWFKLL